ncbi:MAG TPA: radical SAM protein [Alphaproteobacteria bacterium]|nr:radical SAM protein [Alphaproteobacteria bacterium]
MPETADRASTFHIELIKPSHYDDDGYVIQWRRGVLPSNSLACLWGLAADAAERRVLGDDVEIKVAAYDEANIVVPVDAMIAKIKRAGGKGLICLVGVQSNQFPRAVDLAQPFLKAGIAVAIGGFHVSGLLSMIEGLTPELKDAVAQGITLFGGEAEDRMDGFLRDAYDGKLKPIYDYLAELPDLTGQPLPFLPAEMLRRTIGSYSSFDAGRGCPFKCSFCCIINVQGRKSRTRSADEVEALVRTNAAQGINRYFLTDDNFARNSNWEPIFDRLIELKERDGLEIKFIIQADLMVHRIEGFIEKAAAAGCRWVFMGLETVNPDNLLAVKKRQNQIAQYREMLLAWKRAGVVTFAGYILGFEDDTPASIRRDIAFVQRELPVDILEFFIMSPAPGSEDHKRAYDAGVWMDPDLNKGDTEHVVVEHPRMTKEEWQGIYEEAWELYYSDEHVERLIRRAYACGIKPISVVQQVLSYWGMQRFEGIHPLQGGMFRRKVRTARRPGMKREPMITFYPRRVGQIAKTYVPYLIYGLKLHRLRRKIQRDPAARNYTDISLQLDQPATDGAKAPAAAYAVAHVAVERPAVERPAA